jgi:dCMP deaminase
MKEKFKKAYMDVAKTFASLSHAQRLHVGAIVVKDDRIISIGYNGMPAGWDNNCEYKEYDLSRDFNENFFPHSREHYPFDDDTGRYRLKTKPEVLHAESNAISKLARSQESGLGADLFVTHSPCLDCAKLIYQSGIKRVYFGIPYRSTEGIEFLTKSGVEVEQIENNHET